ncbi:MAG: rhomboid family intramembrane serine protease [Porticoccaceae bacterium]|nr:rhomboid family intramembrane serine protease [Porticoccaceae bacterium]
MTEWVKVAQFHPALDLSLLLEKLADRGIDHRITLEDESQVLWVPDDGRLDETAAVVREVAVRLPAREPLQPGPLTLLRRSPVMGLALLLSILGAAVVHWQFQWVHWLTFQDFTFVRGLGPEGAVGLQVEFGTFEDAWAQGQYWRLLTPMFLHFGVFHLAFNGLWLWEFGRRIEAGTGSLHLLMLILVTGAASNWGQYYFGGASLFGGMSGVLYALLGYLWIRHWLAPNPVLALPRGIIVFMLVWLLLCLVGIVDLFMRGSIANAAHVTGLVTGMILGGLFGLLNRQRA